MATINEQLTVPATPAAAFDYVADFTTTAAWDPGIRAARRLDEGPIGLGSRFEVQSRFGLVSLPLTYEITAYEPHERVVLTTRGLLHQGEDDVRFAPDDDGGTVVTWNATFALRGPLRLGDPLLGAGFRRVARKAVAGLEAGLRALNTNHA